MSGMKLSAFWMANFVYDYLLYLVVAIVSAGLCKGFSIDSLSSGEAYTGVWLLFIFYGLAYIPFTYIFAFVFKDYGNAQSGYYFLTFLIGGLLPVLTFILRIISKGSNPVGRGLAWVLRLYPAFSFGEGLNNIGSVAMYSIMENNGYNLSPLSGEIGLAPIIYLVVEFVIYFILLFAV